MSLFVLILSSKFSSGASYIGINLKPEVQPSNKRFSRAEASAIEVFTIESGSSSGSINFPDEIFTAVYPSLFPLCVSI